MTISDDNRRQFELIGEHALAFALATGTLQSLGMTEDKKREALDWIAERRAKRAEEKARSLTERRQTLLWAKIAGWAAIIGVGVGIAGVGWHRRDHRVCFGALNAFWIGTAPYGMRLAVSTY